LTIGAALVWLRAMGDKSKIDKRRAGLARIASAPRPAKPEPHRCFCGAPATIVVGKGSGSTFYCATHAAEAEGAIASVPVYRQK
jgi:hypothetical protein